MRKIGILFGMEDSFQWALIDRINEMKRSDIVAEAIKMGAPAQGVCTGNYALILDRISHDVPFYRSWLKNEVLLGTQVVNDPFWSCADDKFFNNCVALKLDVAVPKTVLLPHNVHPPRTNARSMRNLIYPLNWDEIFSWIGFPAYLKKNWGGGWANVYEVRSPEELWATYNQTGDLVMMLQESVAWEGYYRCYCVGRQNVLVMPYEPRNEQTRRYEANHPPLSGELQDRLVSDTLKLNQALGYDLNTAEFAIRDGIPVAIDFMNSVPDCDRHSVGEANFEWILSHLSGYLVGRVENPPQPYEITPWPRILMGWPIDGESL